MSLAAAVVGLLRYLAVAALARLPLQVLDKETSAELHPKLQ